MLDYLIRNVRVIDGRKGEFDADVAIQGQIIDQVIPPNSDLKAQHIINGEGLVLTSGLIDIHRHADLLPFSKAPWSELEQGLTSIVSGNCGFSAVPNSRENFEEMRRYAAPILGRIPDCLCGMKTREFYDLLASMPKKLNCGYLVGNGDIRRTVCGFSPQKPNAQQMSKMCGLLSEAFDAGALGLSMGIMYTPECYYTTKELSELAKIAERYGKPVIAHIRGEGRSVVQSIDEMIEIGRMTGAKIHISHMKAAGTNMWGHTVDSMLAHIDEARQKGIDVTFDAYPYTAGSTTLLSLFSPKLMECGTLGILERISSPKGRQEVLETFEEKGDDWDNFVQTLGWNRVIVSGSSNPEEAGKSIAMLAKQNGCEPGEYALDLLLREKGNVPVILEEMDPDDVRKIISREDCIVISDSLYSDAGKPHPRKYGAFQRFLCQYVKEEKLLTRCQAIDRVTRMPAEFLGLERRGEIRQGYFADLVLMDWNRLKDRATYVKPNQSSVGVCKVFVNGCLAFDNGQFLEKAAGVLL